MAVEKTITLNIEDKDASKKIKKIGVEVEKVDKEVKKTSASASEMSNQLDKVSGGAITKFNAFKGTLKGVTAGFKTMKLAIISTGLGALVVVIGSLIAAFKGSEEGQNKFAKLTTIIGTVVGNLVDLLADFGETIISVFENPKKALEDFKNLIVQNIENRIKANIDLFGFLGSAIKKVFSGDFSGAIEDAKKAGSSFIDSITGVENTIGKTADAINGAAEATKNFIKEQEKEIAQAARVADMRAKADKIERQLIIDRSKLESEIANLRLKSRQEEEFSATERKQALLDAQKLEEQLLDKETQFLELRRDAQILENTFSRSNKENLTKEAEAIAAVNRQQAARANSARQVQREVNTITKQIEAENKRIQAEIDAKAKLEADAERKRLEEIAKIQEEYRLKQEDNEAQTELQKLELEEARKIKQLDDLNATEEQKLQIENYYRDLKANAQKKADDEELARQKALEAQKIALVQNTLGNLSNALGKTSKAGKAVAIAQALMNTYQGISAELATKTATPFEFGLKLANIASTAAIGFKSVKDIVSTKTPNVSAITGVSSGGGGGGGAVSAPQFNIVGQDSQSQVAQVIGENQQQPVQAYVVANDVTTAQSLNNNIIDGASLG